MAELYGVSTGRLNEQVKRNSKRFPEDFMFQLTKEEQSELIAICDKLAKMKHAPQRPRVFTEQGVAMLSSVLKSERAVQVNIQIMRTFVKIKEMISENIGIMKRLEKSENKLKEHDEHIIKIFEVIKCIVDLPITLKRKPQRIGFLSRNIKQS